MNKGQTIDFSKNSINVNNLGQYVLIDWLEFTIHYEFSTMVLTYDDEKKKSYALMSDVTQRVYDLFEKIFKISRFDVIYEQRGRNGYTGLYYYKHIQAWVTTDVSMGIHFEISGQGCRDLEKLGLEWFSLLRRITSYKNKITRIDLSLDDFTDKYYTVKKIKHYLVNRQIVTKLRTFYNVVSGVAETYDLMGETIQFGSKVSLVHITFYDKLKERESNDYIIDKEIKFWTRTEIRFRNEKAIDVVKHIIEKEELNTIIKGILKDYIRFVVKNKNDYTKWRWKTCQWWLDFLENVDKLELAPIKVYTSIEKKRVWLKDDVSKTLFMVLCSSLDNITLDTNSADIILEQLKGSIDKIKPKDLHLINEYRIANDMIPFTMSDLEGYIRSIKDVIIINGKGQK